MHAKLPGLLGFIIAIGTSSLVAPLQAQTPAPDLRTSAPYPGEKPAKESDTPSSASTNEPNPDASPNPSPRMQLLLPLPGDESDAPDGFAAALAGRSPFASPLVGQVPLRGEYRATWFGSEAVSGQPANLGYFRQDLFVTSPVWQKSGQDEWSVSASIRDEIYQTHAILPDTRQAFPEDLWNIRFSTSYRYLFENGWILGGVVSVGSASDKPFNGLEEMTAGINAFLRIPSGDHNAWLFSLSYSPTSQLPYPIPTVAYAWQPSETFRMNIGLPFMLMWRPTEDLTLDISYMLLTTLHVRESYRYSDKMRLYVGYDSESEAYLLADRIDSNDRFFNVDQRASTGTQILLTKKAVVDLSGGYVFDHYYFEGKNITNGTGVNRVDIGAGPYASAQLQLRW